MEYQGYNRISPTRCVNFFHHSLDPLSMVISEQQWNNGGAWEIRNSPGFLWNSREKSLTNISCIKPYNLIFLNSCSSYSYMIYGFVSYMIYGFIDIMLNSSSIWEYIHVWINNENMGDMMVSRKNMNILAEAIYIATDSHTGFQSQHCGRKKPWLKSLITSTAPPNMGIWWTISGLMGNIFPSVAGISNWAAVAGSRGRWLMIRSITGWWFQTFLCFHILGIIIPTDYIIFFRGVETTNQ